MRKMLLSASFIVSVLLAVFNVKVLNGENQKCYVCIPNTGSSVAEVVKLYPSGPSLPLCNKFEKENEEYIRECPSSKYVGCLTQTNGTHVTKTCSSIAVEDCKTANKIEYCYCMGNLCNDQEVPAEEARPPVTPDSGTGDDDEDTETYSEGSGSSEIDYGAPSPKEREGNSSADDIGVEVPDKAGETNAEETEKSGGLRSIMEPGVPYLICALILLLVFCGVACDPKLLFASKGWQPTAAQA